MDSIQQPVKPVNSIGASQTKRPNFLIILTDDQGYGDLGIHGNKHIETPRLDALGRESVRMEQFHASPLCAPTRASLLTGRDFLKTGVWGVHGGRDFLNLDETTIAEVLRQEGYSTGIFGKWHSGKTNAYLPYNRGFDEAWVASLYKHTDNRMDHNGEHVQLKGWTTDRISEMAADYIVKNRENPFFLFVPYLAPHGPWHAPEEYVNKYRSKGLSESLSTIYGMIEQVDAGVGKILCTIEAAGLRENTVVIYLSDNGPIGTAPNLPDLTDGEMSLRNPLSLRGNKGTIWDNGTRVPCFLSWPGHFRPRVEGKLAQVIDLFPTILDLAGIPIPGGPLPIDGRSLRPLLESGAEWDDSLYFNSKHDADWDGLKHQWDIFRDRSQLAFEKQVNRLSVRNRRYKLISLGDGRSELYDIMSDPGETLDVSGLYPEVCEFLSNELKGWFKDILESGRSHSMASFFIGYKGEQETMIHTFAALDVTGNVRTGSHVSSSWSTPGDSQTIGVEVVERGEYSVAVLADVLKPGSRVAIAIGESSIEGELVTDGETLLGIMKLPEGRTELTITLTTVPEGEGEAFTFEYQRGCIKLRRL